MSEIVVARRYAKAIFELAVENHIADKVGKDIEIIGDLIDKNQNWRRILDNSKIPWRDKQKMIDTVAASLSIQSITVDFLKILTENKRVVIWPLIVKHYKQEMMKLNGEVEAVAVVSDKKVGLELENDIKKIVEALSGKNARIRLKVDPSIIGGIIFKLDDIIYDGSVQGELKRFKEKLLEGNHVD